MWRFKSTFCEFFHERSPLSVQGQFDSVSPVRCRVHCSYLHTKTRRKLESHLYAQYYKILLKSFTLFF